MNDERNHCFFDQCAANDTETYAEYDEPSVKRYMVSKARPAGWYWFCVECAEQIDAEGKGADDYAEWNGGYDHITGERI